MWTTLPVSITRIRQDAEFILQTLRDELGDWPRNVTGEQHSHPGGGLISTSFANVSHRGVPSAASTAFGHIRPCSLRPGQFDLSTLVFLVVNILTPGLTMHQPSCFSLRFLCKTTNEAVKGPPRGQDVVKMLIFPPLYQ